MFKFQGNAFQSKGSLFNLQGSVFLFFSGKTIMRKSTNIILITLLLYGLNIIPFVNGTANCIALSEGCGCHLDDGSGKFDLTPMTKLKPAPMQVDSSLFQEKRCSVVRGVNPFEQKSMRTDSWFFIGCTHPRNRF